LVSLLRFKWLIFGVFAAVSGVAIPAIWLGMAPQYAARAVVRVSPVSQQILYPTEENKGVVPLYEAFVNTQVSIIHSPAVLQRVLDSPTVQGTEWYMHRPRSLRTLLGGNPPTDIERLREDLSVRSRRGTQLIDVSMTGSSAKSVTLIADAVVDAYKQLSDETQLMSGTERYETLSADASKLQKEIDGLQAMRINVSKRVGTTGPEELRSRLATQLSELESEYAKLDRDYKIIQWELETMPQVAAVADDTDTNGESDAEDDTRQLFLVDSEWRALRSALELARHQMLLAQQNYGSEHPQIKALQSDVDFAERQLKTREEQLLAIPPEMVVRGAAGDGGAGSVFNREALERGLERLGRQLELLSKDITIHRAKMNEAADIARDIAHYDEQINNKRNQLDTFRTRLQVLETESKAPARITVASHAIQPSRPSSDRRVILSVMVLVGAGVTGCAAAYVRAATDQKIIEAGDVRTTVNVPFLGHFPPLSPEDAILTDCTPLVRECTRMVRTALLERLKSAEDRVTLITSSASKEGKTTVAILLATSLARLGKKTLLVDADLRNPSVAERLGIEMGGGLAALLSESARDSSVIVPASVPKLDVLPAGVDHHAFDPELLANGVFSACLKRWKKSYDFVLLDSPPVLPVADSRILAGQADGTLMVLRSSHCRRSEVTQAYADLAAAGGRLLGTVLVGARSGSGNRYGYGYGYGYGHGYGHELGGGRPEAADRTLLVADNKNSAGGGA
jgi:capsular exopolysaccharide synthesis family protein